MGGGGPGYRTLGSVLPFAPQAHTDIGLRPNKDVADCLAAVLSTMKPFPPKDAVSLSASACSRTAASRQPRRWVAAVPCPWGLCPYSQERHGAIGLDGCYSEVAPSSVPPLPVA